MQDRWLGVPVYVIGFFSLSMEPIFGLLIPLWALKLEVSVPLVGLIVGGSGFLPAILSIPMGGVADRIGARSLLLWAGAGTALCTALYPFWENPWGLFVLHVIVGLLMALVWISSQAYVAKAGTDEMRPWLMGHFSSATTLGAFAGPLVMGYLLDAWGFTVAFFGASLWVLMVTLMASLLPEAGKRSPLAWSDLRPRLRDFQQAAFLCTIPAILFVILCTFLRLSVFAIRSSYYPVYLRGVDFSAFTIGFLSAISNFVSSFSALAIAPLTRRIEQARLLLLGLALASVSLALTPAFNTFVPLLILTALSGAGIGATLPLLLSILANATGSEVRGLAVGLRTGTNRLSFAVVPIFLGFITQQAGLAAGFYLIGFLQVVMVGGLFLYVGAFLLNYRERM